MDKIQLVLAFLQQHGPDLVVALLAILGGLRVIAQYTPWQGDDHVLDLIEKPVKFLAGLLPKKESK